MSGLYRPLHFEGASGKLECEYCGSTFEVAEIEAMFEEKAAAAMEVGTSWSEKKAAGMTIYFCPSCVNARDWFFLMVRSRAFPPTPNYWQEILDT